MLNKRHGHGMLRCADGTMYDVSVHSILLAGQAGALHSLISLHRSNE